MHSKVMTKDILTLNAKEFKEGGVKDGSLKQAKTGGQKATHDEL